MITKEKKEAKKKEKKKKGKSHHRSGKILDGRKRNSRLEIASAQYSLHEQKRKRDFQRIRSKGERRSERNFLKEGQQDQEEQDQSW
jgi:hypothetical protein